MRWNYIPFPNFNGCTVEVWEWISNFITLYNGCNYLSMLRLQSNHVSKRGPGSSGAMVLTLWGGVCGDVLVFLWSQSQRPVMVSLQWRHNGRGSVSNHQPHHCLLNLWFRRRSKKTSKLRVTGLCVGNSPGTGEFPAQMASNAENVSIWWRHHIKNANESEKEI